MENKNKKILLFLLIIFIVSTLSLVIYITYDKILKADSNKDTSNTLNTKKDSETISEPRTYRFFGYTVDSFEDMYTTLKLYSDGKYTFYTNECEYIGKNSGNYSETDSKIQLSGFYFRLDAPPTHPLRPIIPNNACHLRITAAAGT